MLRKLNLEFVDFPIPGGIVTYGFNGFVNPLNLHEISCVIFCVDIYWKIRLTSGFLKIHVFQNMKHHCLKRIC